MKLGLLAFNIKGMLKDIDYDKHSNEYAFDILNMRIVTLENGSYLALTNERGTSDITLYNEDYTEGGVAPEILTIVGKTLGYCVINKYLVLFTALDGTGTYKDRIYRIKYDSTNSKYWVKLLIAGNFNFDINYPILTLACYENESILKVFWCDGLNLLRFINIVDTATNISRDANNKFGCITNLDSNINVTITKETNTSGYFQAGTILYCFTYLNRYGVETSVFYLSPLYYPSYNDRGVSNDSSVSNTFKLTISNFDSNYDYVRIYCLYRSSANQTVSCRLVTELKLELTSIQLGLEFIDNGLYGSTVDFTSFNVDAASNPIIIPNTMVAKDNTLFCGNIKTEMSRISDTTKSALKGGTITFTTDNNKVLTYNLFVSSATPSYYPYINLLASNNSTNIKYFRFSNYYRFGLLFQFKTGLWSDVVFINDALCNSAPSFPSTRSVKLPYAKYTLTKSNLGDDLDNLLAVRPVAVYPNEFERTIIAQGILNLTVYNSKDRTINSPYAQPSWFFRPYCYGKNPVSTSATKKVLCIGLYGDLKYYNIGEENGSENSLLEALNSGISSVTYNHFNSNRLYELRFNINDPECKYKIEHDKEYTYLKISIDITDATITGNDTVEAYNETIVNSYCGTDNVLIITSNNVLIAAASSLSPVNNEFYFKKSNSYILPIATYVKNMKYVKLDYDIDWFTMYESTSNGISISIPATLSFSNYLEYRDGLIPAGGDSNAEFPFSDTDSQYNIDSNILTFNTPDMPTTNLNDAITSMAIVGYCPITGINSSIFLTTEGSPYATSWLQMDGFLNEYYTSLSVPTTGTDTTYSYGICSNAWWRDSITGKFNYSNADYTQPLGVALYTIYPWHNTDWLNSLYKNYDSSSTLALDSFASIKKKIISNIRYAYVTNRLSTLIGVAIKNLNIVNSDTDLVRLESNNYYPNIDKVLTYTNPNSLDSTRGFVTYPKYTSENIFIEELPRVPSTTLTSLFKNDYLNTLIYTRPLDYLQSKKTDLSTVGISNYYGGVSAAPVSVKYRSTPHLVMLINLTTNTLKDIVYNNSVLRSLEGCLLIANLIRQMDSSIVSTLFGGLSEEALELNQWYVCGDPVRLDTSATTVEIKWTEGDTYYLRWDCIKTLPYTLEDLNLIIEGASIMIETYTNLDGRYDRNRGKLDNTSITEDNFNLINEAYTLHNNNFVGSYLNKNKIDITNFPSNIIWSLTKTYGEEVDSWSKIDMNSILDLDGDKGKLTSLNFYNNNVLFFLDKGIGIVNYNDKVLIATNTNIPIQLANSGKVDGKYYLKDNIGCQNKWSICLSGLGIYFIDDLNKTLCYYGPNQRGDLNVTNLSLVTLFDTWAKLNLGNINSWTPTSTMNNFVCYYDNENKEVYYISNDLCLVYGELFSAFTSFYSYENTPYFINFNDKSLFIKNSTNSTIYSARTGDYNKFFGTNLPFSITLTVNGGDSSYKDKIFNTIEYKGDSWRTPTSRASLWNEGVFDNIQVDNEYLNTGKVELIKRFGLPSNKKEKYRVWRLLIPRDEEKIYSNNQWIDGYGRDRIRNPWTNIKLSKELFTGTYADNANNKSIVHNFISYYLE